MKGNRLQSCNAWLGGVGFSLFAAFALLSGVASFLRGCKGDPGEKPRPPVVTASPAAFRDPLDGIGRPQFNFGEDRTDKNGAKWHNGDDIMLPDELQSKSSASAYPIADGEIVAFSPNGWSTDPAHPDNYGIVVRHVTADGKTFYAVYGHLLRPTTKDGGSETPYTEKEIRGMPKHRVRPDEALGIVGRWLWNGKEADHLHFGIYRNPSDENSDPPDPYGIGIGDPPAEKIREDVPARAHWIDPLKFLERYRPR